MVLAVISSIDGNGRISLTLGGSGGGTTRLAFSVNPMISGSTTIGAALSGDNGTITGGTAPYSYSYAWQRSFDNGGTWSGIPGQTGKNLSANATGSFAPGTLIRRRTTVTDSSTPTAQTAGPVDSNFITLTASTGVPSAVSDLAGATVSASQIDWSWTLPANGGSALTDGEFQISSDGGTTWGTAVNLTAGQTSISSTGLTSATTYTARVRFQNTNGFGNYSNLGVAPTQAPFLTTANTHWWDFTSTPNLKTDTNGTETISFVRERVGNKSPLVQALKAKQPLKITDGLNGNQATYRRLEVRDLRGIANAKTGWYFAANFKPATTAQVLMAIGRNSASLVPSRGLIDFTSSRVIRVSAVDNDGSTVAVLGTTPAQTLGVSMTIEVQFATGSPATAQVWINGLLQTLTSGTSPNIGAFPSSDPFLMTIGNGITSTNSLNSVDGSLQQAVFENGVIDSTTRASISSFLNSVRQA